MLVFSRAGRAVSTIRVGAGGQFAIHLPAGVYGVRAAPALLGGNLTPAQVRVPRSGTIYLRLQLRRTPTPAPAGADG